MENIKGNWDFRAPFNRLVDEADPESETARKFRNLVQQYLESNFQDQSAELSIREFLTSWSENDRKLQPILQKSFLLREVAPLSQDLAVIGTTGLLALDYLHRSQASTEEWRMQQLAQLRATNAQKADLLLMVAEPVERLVQATDGRFQLQR